VTRLGTAEPVTAGALVCETTGTAGHALEGSIASEKL